MKKLYLFTFVSFAFLFINSLNAQVGIGNVSPNGALDISSTNDGLLVPRIALTNTTTSTVITPTISEMVYNTATINDVTPGYYYWDGAKWVKIASTASDWSLTGNTGTTAGTNYLGTNDSQNLQLRTGGSQRLTIDGTNGNVAIGTAVVAPTTKLEVSSGPTSDAVSGHSNNVGGTLGKEINISFGTPSQTLFGSGVYANNPTAGYTSMFAQSTGTATVAANIAFSDVWIASYNYVQNNTAGFNPPGSYSQLNVTNSVLAGNQVALSAYSSRGTTTGNPGTTVGLYGTADSQNQDALAVQGVSFSNSTVRAGGYFAGYNYAGTAASASYAYVGGTTNGGATLRKIIGNGSVSEIIPTEDHGRVTLTCPESPEYWYQDYGTVQMVNGHATINLDEILAGLIIVDEENPIRVICTPVAMPYFNGITIMSQTKTSVDILELNGGNHSGKLQYQLVAKPKTNYGEGRFPQAPGPSYLKADKEPIAAKAKNQPNDGRKIFQWKPDHEVYKYNPEDFVAIGDIIPGGPHAGKVKLGNGKYGHGMPAENPTAKK